MKERYIRIISGAFYWIPTKKMKAAGFRSEPLGKDLAKANASARALNTEWDAIRKEMARDPLKIERGTFRQLIDEFQKDPTWYAAKGKSYQYALDRSFKDIGAKFGDFRVNAFTRRHARRLYNNTRRERGPHVARDLMKHFKRIMEYAVEIGMIEHNPTLRLKMEPPPPRNVRWIPGDVQAVIQAALHGGTFERKDGKPMPYPPRRSVALATAIAYDTSLPMQDILSLVWAQWDGEGFTVKQIKKRGQRKLFCPVSAPTRQLIADTLQTSPQIIISETTGKPYQGRTDFGRMFRKFRKRVGAEGVTFHDLRRSALSEFGDSGATEAEIIKFSGHAMGSKVLDTYVRPDKAAARSAAKKRWEDGKV